MFKLAAFTDEISQDLAHACTVLRGFGGEGAELRGVGGTAVNKFSDAQVREIKQILADAGIAAVSMGSPFGKCELADGGEVAQHMDILRRCCDIGLELGCNLVRGFAFWDRQQAGEKPWDAMLAAYEPVPGILEEKGCILGLENEAACYVGAAGHARRFLDALGCERVKAIWDPANHIQDPQSEGCPPFPDGYELLKPDIVHVHVKDAAPDGQGRCPNCFLGEGLAQWPQQLQALKDDGYKGCISLETHVKPERLTPELRERYGQHIGGDERESASKVCLAWLRDTVDALA